MLALRPRSYSATNPDAKPCPNLTENPPCNESST